AGPIAPEHDAGQDGREGARERAERAEDPQHAALLLGAGVKRDEAAGRGVDEPGADREQRDADIKLPLLRREADDQEAEGGDDEPGGEDADLLGDLEQFPDDETL